MAERRPNTATSSSGCLLQWKVGAHLTMVKLSFRPPPSLQRITLPLGLPPPGMSQPYSGAKAPHKNLRLLTQPPETTPNKSASNTNSSTRGGHICSRRVVAFHIKCLEAPPFHSCLETIPRCVYGDKNPITSTGKATAALQPVTVTCKVDAFLDLWG